MPQAPTPDASKKAKSDSVKPKDDGKAPQDKNDNGVSKGASWGRIFCRLMYTILLLAGLVMGVSKVFFDQELSPQRIAFSRCFGTAFATEASRMRLQASGKWGGYGEGHAKCESKTFLNFPLLFGDRSVRGWSATHQGDYQEGLPNGDGQYVSHSAWFEYVMPPYRYEGPDRVFYTGNFKNNRRDGRGILEVSPLATKYQGEFHNNSFHGDDQQIDFVLNPLKNTLHSSAASAMPSLGLSSEQLAEAEKTATKRAGGRAVLFEDPTANSFLWRNVRYYGATKAGGIPHGKGAIYFRGKGLSSFRNWTMVAGDWENGVLVTPTGEGFKVVTGTNTKKDEAVATWLKVSEWANARSALVGHRQLSFRIGDYAWDGTQFTRSDGQSPIGGQGDAIARALGHALEALHVFEDHIRAESAVEFVEQFEFLPLYEQQTEVLKQTGEWYSFSPAKAQEAKKA